MADAMSHSSLESDEFVLVNGEPRLKVPNGSSQELERKMSEALDTAPSSTHSSTQHLSERVEVKDHPLAANVNSQAEEKADPDENQRIYSNTSAVNDEEATVFTNVTYLGSASVNAPRSETEINRNMQVLNEQTQMVIPITLVVPGDSEGTVLLLDPNCNSEISSYKIHSILFCARGPADSDESNCFAFTCSHGKCQENAIFQCHVFRCEQQEANVSRILYSFATAFRRIPRTPSSHMGNQGDQFSDLNANNLFTFSVSMDLREDDGKGNFSTCPREKNVYKLRKDVERKIVITVTQISENRPLKIERCFGLLISPGRNVKHSDMQLIEMVSMGSVQEGKAYQVSGEWDPTDPSFQILNCETPKDTRVFMTLAVDLVIEGIQEPVRFLLESKAKIYPTNERFWYFSKKPYVETFILQLKEVENCNPGNASAQEMQYEVVGCRSQSQIDREKAAMTLPLSNARLAAQNITTPGDPDGEESDNDEPLMSGSGIVSKDVTDENLLESWHEALTKWHQNLKHKPKQVSSLVRKGIPEALRGEVWQLLTGCDDHSDMLEAYRILITKDSPSEQTISRDINRTFPAHDYFRETGGLGQESLFKISKAYSIYDEEIGYCQGLSFLAAALILHMPEEQAFCVLVKIMFDYGLRDMFKQGFEDLHLKFYQLERLLQDNLSDIHEHFVELGLEAHMYASQWFLTLFTAKFPLFMVFHILDIFLSEGMDTIFRVSLALLKTSRKDLLALDFEGTLKYFRVSLPKKYRTEECAHELIQTAVAVKVSSRKLKKYEKEYQVMRETQLQQEDPHERLERENKRLVEANMRLEQENDDLAHELVTSKIALRNDLDTAEDKGELLTKELLATKTALVDTEDEKKRVTHEALQLKGLFRQQQEKADSENKRNQAIITDYKQICSQLSDRLEKQQAAHKAELQRVKDIVSSCKDCNAAFDSDENLKKVEPRAPNEAEINPLLSEKERTIRELELELAQTKLALVESECKVQDLTHELNSAIGEIQESKNTWFHKTLTSLREVTTSSKKDGSSASGLNSSKKDGGSSGMGSSGALSALARSLSKDEVSRKNSKESSS